MSKVTRPIYLLGMFLPLLCLLGGVSQAAPGQPAAKRPVVKKPAVKKPAVKAAARSAPKLPPNAPPSIYISGTTQETRSAEGRLARFITAMQTGYRKKASELFSSRVTPQERQAFIEKKWLRYSPVRNQDFNQVLYFKDLQIRYDGTQNGLFRMYVGSRRVPFRVMATKKGIVRFGKKTDAPVGWLWVPMRKEDGKWWVELHP